jgi:hypothetical protein
MVRDGPLKVFEDEVVQQVFAEFGGSHVCCLDKDTTLLLPSV